jgi:hypothetical protein
VVFRQSLSQATVFSDLSLRHINKADRLVLCLTDVNASDFGIPASWRQRMRPNPLTFEGNILLRQINAASPSLS